MNRSCMGNGLDIASVPHRRGDEPEILKLVEYSINFDEKLDTYGLFSTSS